MGDKKKKLVKICKKCSGIDKDDLKGVIKGKEVKVDCIDLCKKHKGKVFGYIKGDLVVCDTKEQFLKIVKDKV